MLSELYLCRIALRREQIGKTEDYVFSIPAIRNLTELRLTAPVTLFVGENGSGKSTLLEAVAVACGFNPEGGGRNFTFSTRPTHSALWRCLSVSRGVRYPRDGFFMRAESFYNLATEVDRIAEEDISERMLASYGGRSLHAQSHGESFLSLALQRFGEEGLYILDEPEAALSPQNQLVLLARIHQLARAGSQFLIATHSPILMALPGATLYQLREDAILPTDYQQTEHFQLMKQFVNNPQRILRYLLEEEPEPKRL